MAPAARPADESTYSGRFAARLRMLREKTGMSGQQFVEALQAQGLSIKQSGYYSWESGQSEPPFDSLPTLAKCLALSSPRLLFPVD